jgi:hypothetical protein
MRAISVVTRQVVPRSKLVETARADAEERFMGEPQFDRAISLKSTSFLIAWKWAGRRSSSNMLPESPVSSGVWL